MAECNHDCASCNQDCKDRDFTIKPHKGSSFKKTIAIVSGKGGVGKSSVTSLLAVTKLRENKNVAIIDADITGPSIPQMFGARGEIYGDDDGMYPYETKEGIKLFSMNLLLKRDVDPVVWRGPMIAGAVKQFYTDVNYGECDYLFIDLPPGTGDVPLTVFQSIPLTGIVIVLTPQDLVSVVVAKAVNMAKEMNIPIIGLVENMSYVKCPNCNEEIHLFGEGKVEALSKEYNIPILAKIPFDKEIASLCDKGDICKIEHTYFEEVNI